MLPVLCSADNIACKLLWIVRSYKSICSIMYQLEKKELDTSLCHSWVILITIPFLISSTGSQRQFEYNNFFFNGLHLDALRYDISRVRHKRRWMVVISELLQLNHKSGYQPNNQKVLSNNLRMVRNCLMFKGTVLQTSRSRFVSRWWKLLLK